MFVYCMAISSPHHHSFPGLNSRIFSLPIFFTELVTKCCGRNCDVFRSFSKNNFTFLLTIACFSLSAFVKTKCKRNFPLNQDFLKSQDRFFVVNAWHQSIQKHFNKIFSFSYIIFNHLFPSSSAA